MQTFILFKKLKTINLFGRANVGVKCGFRMVLIDQQAWL